MNSFFFRVDANVDVGIGHAKRCFAIAKEISKITNGKIYFLSEELPIGFIEQIKSHGFEILFKEINCKSEIEFIANSVLGRAPVALIIDSYNEHFYPEDFQLELLTYVDRLAYIVFRNEEFTYHSHILHNQNPLSVKSIYRIQPYTKCLFGLNNLILDDKLRRIAQNYTYIFPMYHIRTIYYTVYTH